MKQFYRLFTAVFLLLCLMPLAGMLFLDAQEAAGNQVLATAPSLTERDGSWNEAFLTDVSDFVSDRFAFRQELLTLRARLTASVFGESATEQVILGREGWLFYADTLPDYEGTAPLSERQLFAAARTLALVQEYAETRGAAFLFTVAPNKNTLYPAYMPSRYEKTTQPSNWTRLMAQLDAQGVAYVDLLPVLAACDVPVYYRTDSHWNDYGAALASDAILEALGGAGTLAQEPFTASTHLGDLCEMLYPAGAAAETCPVLARERTFSHVSAFRSPEDMTIHTESSGDFGSLLMFRDSFGNNLYAHLAEAFSACCFSRAMPLNLTMLAEEGADTLLFELVERNLSWLISKPPVMEAPIREAVAAEAAGEAAVEVTQSALENLCCYEGSIAALDVDSPIYLSLDGIFYEATPAGTGENPFTLYAPPADTVELFYRLDGIWHSITAA